MSPSPASTAAPSAKGRVALVFGTVACFHVAALWALNSGLIQRVQAEVKPPEPILAELIVPPPPEPIELPKPMPVAPPPPVEKPKPRPAPPPPKPRVQPKPAPQPLASRNAEESAPAVPAPSPPAPPEPPPAPPAPPAPPVPPAPPPQPPTPPTAASHLNNPKPEYPRASREMGEEGTTLLRVLVSADGRAEQVEVKRSSGYDRLDQSALRAVRKWRFRPGTRNGEPYSAWFDLPIVFNLER
ncbi:hypothetical protein CCO03_09560 [Comamonas serinivorans]|uniref:Protein TonB n=1 Tax=Comamonas serinivorans TaxID=1082851 RepID=A0A1Y0EML3_9BURK|nr:energy transducer TonB [Comamonas serinivorans]ARU04895.1 hypothetical protein CCO03_09560 [Comamonas serinivorans]